MQDSSPEFRDFWAANYSGMPPAGYVLCSSLKKRWIRFHSLPNSRRYPETDADYETLLLRANTIANACFHEGCDCWLISSRNTRLHRRLKKRWKRDLQLPFHLCAAFKWRLDPEDPEEPESTVFVGKCNWSSGAFDPVLRKISNGEYSHVMWASFATGAVFAPYDGGFDLILPSENDVAVFKDKYSNWLSDRPDGL